MAPPELQLINRIWNGSPSKAGCIAWFGAGDDAWGAWAERSNLEMSTPEICGGRMNAACAHTAFCVAKLLSAKSSDDGKICFDLDWADAPKDAIAAGQLERLFFQVDKVFLVRVDLADDMSHSFVVTSYAGPSQLVCCGLYMSYATAVGGGKYALPEFLKGNLEFAPKPDKDISMTDFIRIFSKLFQADVTETEFRGAWQTLFGCGPGSSAQLKQALVKVLDRTALAPNHILQQLESQWPKCPHGR